MLFWDEETEETGPCISLKIAGSFTRLFFQSSSEWLHMEVPYKIKTFSISRRKEYFCSNQCYKVDFVIGLELVFEVRNRVCF